MLRQPASRTNAKPRQATPYSFAAPTRGWVANQNLANTTQNGAAVLENWFPTAIGTTVRSGSDLYATLGDGGLPVQALFGYLNGPVERFFAATDTTIYDVTTVAAPDNVAFVSDTGDTFVTDTGDTFGYGSTDDLGVLFGMTSGNWSVVQFATAGGVFLVGVNGQDDAFLFDGAEFYPISGQAVGSLAISGASGTFTAGQTVTGGTSGATATLLRKTGNTLLLRGGSGTFQNAEAVSTGTGSATASGTAAPIVGAFAGVPTSSLSYVWVYKQRLFFVEKNGLNAWYLPVDQVSGAAVKFPLGGVFGRGGSLLFGATWSLDSGGSGGLSEQCVFVSTEGEVAVYQGLDPSSSTSWSKVGVYRIGRPLGPKAFIRAGGDLVIATDIGLIPLSQAIRRDVAALSPAAVSFPIETAWNERVEARSGEPWHCEIWPTKQRFMVALPTVTDARPEMLVANARTGAWTLYTGWNGRCLLVFKDRLFFGSDDGKIVEAEVTGADQGVPYTASCLPLFQDLKSPTSFKTAETARAVLLSPNEVNERLSVQTDFVVSLPPPPDAAAVTVGSVWGLGVWGQSVWGAEAKKQTQERWRSVGGAGYTMAPAIQVTIGGVPPPQIDLVRLDLTVQRSDIGL